MNFKEAMKMPAGFGLIRFPVGGWLIFLFAWNLLWLGGFWVGQKYEWLSWLWRWIEWRGPGAFIVWALFVAVDLFSMTVIFLSLRKLIRSSNETILIYSTLGTALFAFIFEKFAMDSAFFSPFPFYIDVSLWGVFAFLALSLFREHLPPILTIFLPAVYLYGFFLSLGFVIVLLPLMAISWIAIPVLFGALTYAPLLSVISFVYSGMLSAKSLAPGARRVSQIFSAATGVAVVGYIGWLFAVWTYNDHIVKTKSLPEPGYQLLDQDLPSWVRIGRHLQNSFATEMWLQPAERNFSLFETGKIFDPFAFVAHLATGGGFDRNRSISLTDEERSKLLMLLFHKSHNDLERLWSGHTLITSAMSTHLQVYPDLRLAYTELTLEVFNEGKWRGEGIWTLTLPEGSAAVKLRLWIDGVEESGRLALKETARRAYRTIVGVESRDPSLLEWMEGNRLRLRVFPVQGGKKRTVKVGFVSPLMQTNDKLFLAGAGLEGPPLDRAENAFELDLFSGDELKAKAQGFRLKEKLTSDQHARNFSARSGAADPWSLEISAPKASTPVFSWQGRNYRLKPRSFQNETLKPKTILVLLNQGLPKDAWKKQIEALFQDKSPDTKIVLASDRFFESKSLEKILAWLKEEELPKFQLFPFDRLPAADEVLVLTGPEAFSVPPSQVGEVGEALGSSNRKPFLEKLETYFANRKTPVYLMTFSGEASIYHRCLAERGHLVLLEGDEKKLSALLRTGSVRTPLRDPSVRGFDSAGFEIVEASGSAAAPAAGTDHLLRLFHYKTILEARSRGLLRDEADKTSLLALAREANVVSPISSLIVLEKKEDYDRFGISKTKGGLGEAEAVNPNMGQSAMVPEPAEWIFLSLFLVLAIWLFRKKFLRRERI